LDEKNRGLYESFTEKRTETELGAEVSDLKDKLNAMESTLRDIRQSSNNIWSGTTQSANMQQVPQATSQLQDQIRDFKNQTSQQQQQTQQQLQNSINQAMGALSQATQFLQSHQALTQMNQLIDQTEKQLNQLNQQNIQNQQIQQLQMQNQQVLSNTQSMNRNMGSTSTGANTGTNTGHTGTSYPSVDNSTYNPQTF
jgi:uncharacterized phage infection (PIP) family protein YhgE